VSWLVCRVERQEGSWTDMGDLKKGDVVKGRIKRLEAFGAFVELHNSTLTGLAHISEVSDDFIKTLEDSFQVGQGMGVCVDMCLRPASVTCACDTMCVCDVCLSQLTWHAKMHHVTVVLSCFLDAH